MTEKNLGLTRTNQIVKLIGMTKSNCPIYECLPTTKIMILAQASLDISDLVS